MELVGKQTDLPDDTERMRHFCIEDELVYEAFSRDFGPLHLGMVKRYCLRLDRELNDAAPTGRLVIHCCSSEPQKRSNAAFLICAYQVIVMHVPADVAFAPFQRLDMSFLAFRDASGTKQSMFDLTILDCLHGLEFAIRMDWFNYAGFNVSNFEFFSRVDKGDMNWIIPRKFLAFCGPSPTPIDTDGYPAFTPEDYAPIFRKIGVSLVIRLNKKQYDRNIFIDRGVKHVDLYFKDGSCPPPEIISTFFRITEHEPHAVGVHCKAGLGRTGTLIGLYAMKHFGMPARAFIGWNRLCRPGSVLGPQQQFLVDMQNCMFQSGFASRSLQAIVSPPLKPSEPPLTHFERQQAESYEDVGQGERLCGARRASQPKASYCFAEDMPPMVSPKGGMSKPLVTVGKCMLSTEPHCMAKQMTHWENPRAVGVV
jgi:cell division cycle 14